MLIEFVLDYYSKKGEQNLFLPSAIHNTKYYEKFGFQGFGGLKNLGNTQVKMMKIEL